MKNIEKYKYNDNPLWLGPTRRWALLRADLEKSNCLNESVEQAEIVFNSQLVRWLAATSLGKKLKVWFEV